MPMHKTLDEVGAVPVEMRCCASGTTSGFPDNGVVNLLEPGAKTPLSQSSWLFAAIGKLSNLTRLPDNWDSMGGKPLGDAEKRLATRLLMQTMHEPLLDLPAIIPTFKGGVQLEWQLGGKELEVEIKPGESVVYVLCANSACEDGGEEKDLDFKDSNAAMAEFDKVIKWLISDCSGD